MKLKLQEEKQQGIHLKMKISPPRDKALNTMTGATSTLPKYTIFSSAADAISLTHGDLPLNLDTMPMIKEVAAKKTTYHPPPIQFHQKPLFLNLRSLSTTDVTSSTPGNPPSDLETISDDYESYREEDKTVSTVNAIPSKTRKIDVSLVLSMSVSSCGKENEGGSISEEVTSPYFPPTKNEAILKKLFKCII